MHYTDIEGLNLIFSFYLYNMYFQAQNGFSMTGEPGGRGGSAYVTMTKTKAFFRALEEAYIKDQKERNYLTKLISCGRRNVESCTRGNRLQTIVDVETGIDESISSSSSSSSSSLVKATVSTTSAQVGEKRSFSSIIDLTNSPDHKLGDPSNKNDAEEDNLFSHKENLRNEKEVLILD